MNCMSHTTVVIASIVQANLFVVAVQIVVNVGSKLIAYLLFLTYKYIN